LTGQTDSAILEMCRNKDSMNYGFHLLVNKYQQKVYWHVRRMVFNHEDANDIVQDIFVKIWKNLDSFRKESQLYTWIYRIATNETLSFIKKKKRKHLLSLTGYENYIADKLMDDNFFTGDEIHLRLQMALLKLPEKQRLVFNMKYYDEMKYNEISEVLGTSVGALKASYHIAVKKIENSVKGD